MNCVVYKLSQDFILRLLSANEKHKTRKRFGNNRKVGGGTVTDRMGSPHWGDIFKSWKDKRVGQATICRRNISGRGKSKCKASRQAMCLVYLGTSLSADGQGCIPTLAVVWPEASLHWSLQVVGQGWVSGVWGGNDGLQEGSDKCPCPGSETEPALPLQESLWYSQVGLALSLMSSLLFSPWVFMCIGPCRSPSRMKFVSPIPVKSLPSNPLYLKARWPGVFFSCSENPRQGSSTWDSGFSLLWENFCGIIISQFEDHSSSRYGIRFYCDCVPLPIFLCFLFVFGLRVYFFSGFLWFILSVSG